ncbi:uncharacterized protein LOC106535995 [Austrofundulus limnaeus]|uniref:Uncharacterized protein LOC106535995 n=1 Tax=Austrofundulus limnaeus TaxID=52670 RepID=A0A2I4D8Q5_AUSLI|nr:PREDICTED: uncharacterized protein LOC106535995 [Austrofundulus limnaeus]
MATLLTTLFLLGLMGKALPDMVEPGPLSGVVLREQPGLLITNCRLYAQKVYVRFNPLNLCHQQASSSMKLASWAGNSWNHQAVQHAEADITHMLEQLQKFTISRSELSGTGKREKRFIGGILTAASAIGSLFSLGISSVNAVNIAAIKRHVAELQNEIPRIQLQLDEQQDQLTQVGKTVLDTVLVVNTHSTELTKLAKAVTELSSVIQIDYAYTQLITMLLTDMLREISSSIDTLVIGKIPPYLVSLQMVQDILLTTTTDRVTP